MAPKEIPSYNHTRLAFRRDIIEPLAADARFRIITPAGTYEMTRAEFYRDFQNVAKSKSFLEQGLYHYTRTPVRALRYLQDGLPSPQATDAVARARPRSVNRQLSDTERESLFAPLIAQVRTRLRELSGEDGALHWALRRKLAKELSYDERGKPMHRVALKRQKRVEQDNRCAICQEVLPDPGAVLDRLEAMKGYTKPNTRLLCPSCDTGVQQGRGYS